MAPKCLSWKDSNAHHVLRGTFGGADITRRLKLCCCDPCLLRNKWSGCLSNRVDRGTWHGDRQGPRVILPVKVPKKMELRGVISLDSIRHWPVFVHPNNVNVLKRVVAVRIHPSERQGTTELCHLGKVRSACYQLDERCELHGNTYEKGWWVFEMQWYHRMAAHDASGSRTYRLGTAAVDNLVYNLAAVVSGVGAVGFAKKRKLKGGGGELYCLPESEHEKILSCGHLGV